MKMFVFLLAVTILNVAATQYFLRKAKKTAGKEGDRDEKCGDILKLMGFEDIKNGVIVMSNNRFCAVVETGSINFDLLSEEEQYAVENSIMRYVRSLNFPVEIIVQSRKVDNKAAINKLAENYEKLPETLRVYAEDQVAVLSQYMAVEFSMDRKICVVVNLEGYKNFDKARSELQRRARVIKENLRRINVDAEMLDTAGVTDFIFNMLNKGKKLHPESLIKAGALELYKTGSGVNGLLVYREDTDERQQEKTAA